MKMYGIPNCDKVRMAKNWMQLHGLEYEFVNLREQPPQLQLLQQWLEELGAKQLVNTRSTTWKSLSISERSLINTDPATLLHNHPILIRRPVVQTSMQLVCGYVPEQYEELFK